MRSVCFAVHSEQGSRDRRIGPVVTLPLSPAVGCAWRAEGSHRGSEANASFKLTLHAEDKGGVFKIDVASKASSTELEYCGRGSHWARSPHGPVEVNRSTQPIPFGHTYTHEYPVSLDTHMVHSLHDAPFHRVPTSSDCSDRHSQATLLWRLRSSKVQDGTFMCQLPCCSEPLRHSFFQEPSPQSVGHSHGTNTPIRNTVSKHITMEFTQYFKIKDVGTWTQLHQACMSYLPCGTHTLLQMVHMISCAQACLTSVAVPPYNSCRSRSPQQQQ